MWPPRGLATPWDGRPCYDLGLPLKVMLQAPLYSSGSTGQQKCKNAISYWACVKIGYWRYTQDTCNDAFSKERHHLIPDAERNHLIVCIIFYADTIAASVCQSRHICSRMAGQSAFSFRNDSPAAAKQKTRAVRALGHVQPPCRQNVPPRRGWLGAEWNSGRAIYHPALIPTICADEFIAVHPHLT